MPTSARNGTEVGIISSHGLTRAELLKIGGEGAIMSGAKSVSLLSALAAVFFVIVLFILISLVVKFLFVTCFL